MSSELFALLSCSVNISGRDAEAPPPAKYTGASLLKHVTIACCFEFLKILFSLVEAVKDVNIYVRSFVNPFCLRVLPFSV